jgi:hypothetical protein
MPEKSGMVAAFSVSWPAIPAGGTTACPKAGSADAAANILNGNKYRRTFMLAALFMVRLAHPVAAI